MAYFPNQDPTQQDPNATQSSQLNQNQGTGWTNVGDYLNLNKQGAAQMDSNLVAGDLAGGQTAQKAIDGTNNSVQSYKAVDPYNAAPSLSQVAGAIPNAISGLYTTPRKDSAGRSITAAPSLTPAQATVTGGAAPTSATIDPNAKATAGNVQTDLSLLGNFGGTQQRLQATAGAQGNYNQGQSNWDAALAGTDPNGAIASARAQYGNISDLLGNKQTTLDNNFNQSQASYSKAKTTADASNTANAADAKAKNDAAVLARNADSKQTWWGRKIQGAA